MLGFREPPSDLPFPYQNFKEKLKEILESEDKKQPLNDERLAELLGKEEYHIARRTVAKYRDQLKFPVARLRKTL